MDFLGVAVRALASRLIWAIASSNPGGGVAELLEIALEEGASDLHIEPEGEVLKIRIRAGYGLVPIATLPFSAGKILLSRIKALAGADLISEVAYEGKIRVRVGGRLLSARFSLVPTAEGEKIVIRFFSGFSPTANLSELGLPPELEEIVRHTVSGAGGVILSGPTGSGKTTTLYSLMKLLVSQKKGVFAVEDLVEMRIEGVTQIDASAHGGFDSSIRHLLRQDPDVVVIGEIRDRETARAFIQAATTGHLSMATLHSDSLLGIFGRMKRLGVSLSELSATLKLALSQRVVSRRCTMCGGRGCESCSDSGRMGRVGIFGWLEGGRWLQSAAAVSHGSLSSFIPEFEAGFRGSPLSADLRDKLAKGVVYEPDGEVLLTELGDSAA